MLFQLLTLTGFLLGTVNVFVGDVDLSLRVGCFSRKGNQKMTTSQRPEFAQTEVSSNKCNPWDVERTTSRASPWYNFNCELTGSGRGPVFIAGSEGAPESVRRTAP